MNAFPLKFVVALVFMAALVLSGWMARGWKEDSERLFERENYVATLQKNIRLWAGYAGQVSDKLGAERRAREKARLDFEAKLRAVKPSTLVVVSCPSEDVGEGELDVPESAGGPAVGFNAEFVGLWNDGLEQGATEAERAGRAEAESGGAGVASVTDLLSNLGENSRRWAECRSQVRGFQEWSRKHGFME